MYRLHHNISLASLAFGDRGNLAAFVLVVHHNGSNTVNSQFPS